MTDLPTGIVCVLRRGPRSEPPPEWDARRHAAEAAYWAAISSHLGIEKLMAVEKRIAQENRS